MKGTICTLERSRRAKAADVDFLEDSEMESLESRENRQILRRARKASESQGSIRRVDSTHEIDAPGSFRFTTVIASIVLSPCSTPKALKIEAMMMTLAGPAVLNTASPNSTSSLVATFTLTLYAMTCSVADQADKLDIRQATQSPILTGLH